MLTVIEEIESRFLPRPDSKYMARIRRVRCKCDCGNIVERDYPTLPKLARRGRTSSCGCILNKPKEITKDITPIPDVKSMSRVKKRELLTNLINQDYTNKEIILKTGLSTGFISKVRSELGKSFYSITKTTEHLGKKYGRVTVLEILPSTNRKIVVLGECECGTKKPFPLRHLISGGTRSCGCLASEVARNMMKNTLIPNNVIHGDRRNTKHRYLYDLWQGMKQRCYNPKNKRYSTYGARGITVYEPWIDNYSAFKEYVLTNLGERYDAGTGKRSDNESMDRIDVNKGYEPGNLRWADFTTQAINKSRNTIKNYKTRPVLESEGVKLLTSQQLHDLYYEYYGVRCKRGHVIHHIDWDSSNDSKENLLMVSRREHGWLHQTHNHKLRKKKRDEIILILESIKWD